MAIIIIIIKYARVLCWALRATCDDGRTRLLCVANCSAWIIMSVTKSYYCNKLRSLQFISSISICLVATAAAAGATTKPCHRLLSLRHSKIVIFVVAVLRLFPQTIFVELSPVRLIYKVDKRQWIRNRDKLIISNSNRQLFTSQVHFHHRHFRYKNWLIALSLCELV